MNRISHEHLAVAVKAAAKFCPGARCPKPILRTVRVSRGGDDVTTVTATDLDSQIVIFLAGGSGSGVSLVPAEAAKAGVRCVEYDDNVVVAGGITAPAADPMEYPHHSLLQSPPAATLWFDAVERIADVVATVTDDSSSRFSMSGVCLESDGDRVVAVGTDGRRLHAIDTESVTGLPDKPIDLIVPPRVFTGLARSVRAVARDVLALKGRRLESHLRESKVEVLHSESEVELRWSCDGVTVSVRGRKIKGPFPKWRDVLPAGFCDGVIILPVKEGTDQLRAASRVQTERAKGVLFSGGQVTAGTESSGIFSAPIAGAMNCPAAVRLDPRFVIDALSAVKAFGWDEAELLVHQGSSVALLKCRSYYGGDLARLRIAIETMGVES